MFVDEEVLCGNGGKGCIMEVNRVQRPKVLVINDEINNVHVGPVFNIGSHNVGSKKFVKNGTKPPSTENASSASLLEPNDLGAISQCAVTSSASKRKSFNTDVIMEDVS